MGFRLLLLMAMGLGAMYMMHLLAQDYNKIRQPVAAATRFLTSASAGLVRGKRDTSEKLVGDNLHQQPLNTTMLTVNWKRILSRDPFECLQSLICQIMSGAESNSKEAEQLMDFLQASLTLAPPKVAKAFGCGLAFRGNTERCYDEYPFCFYSARTMLRVLNWFSENGLAEVK